MCIKEGQHTWRAYGLETCWFGMANGRFDHLKT